MFGCEKIYRETISGAEAERPELTQPLGEIVSGDMLAVGRLDRLARSTRDLLNILDTLAARGVAFMSLGDAWADTVTPRGGLMLTVIGGPAEFERGLARARTGDGRARAVARGRHMGRTLTPHQRRAALAALAAGTKTQADLARQFNVNGGTISRLADKAASTPPPLTAKPALDTDTERAVRAFLKQLEGKYPVVDSIVYGSRARGDHKPDSDADLAVILKGARGDRYEVSGEFAGIEFHVLMETGVMVQGFPLWEDELKRPETFSNPALIANILREGVHL